MHHHENKGGLPPEQLLTPGLPTDVVLSATAEPLQPLAQAVVEQAPAAAKEVVAAVETLSEPAAFEEIEPEELERTVTNEEIVRVVDDFVANTAEVRGDLPYIAQDAAAEEEPMSEGTGVGWLPPSATTQMDHDVFFPLQGEWDETGAWLVGQADTLDRTQRALDSLPNLDLSATETGREWVDYEREALNVAPNKDQWRAAVDRDGSAWRQQVDSRTGKIAMGALNLSNVSEGKVSGEKAVMQVKALTGLGSVIQTPLWHSGFHISIKAPKDTELLSLNQRMLDEKIILGRTTNGLAFANTSSYMTGCILDFVMDHIYDTSLQTKDKDQVRALIQGPDLPILFWGLACAVWPRGFQYARPYVNPDNKQTVLLKEKLSVGKLLWTDLKSLTPFQISHMANKQNASMSLDSVRRYREEFIVGKQRRVQLSDKLAVVLRVPSGNEYVAAGNKWIAEITQTVDTAFELEPGDGRRADYIVSQGKATSMRQYTHWVESIHAGKIEIVDQETLEATLSELSADDGIRGKFFDAMHSFIDDSTMAIIATPAAVQEESQTKPKFPHLLPLNVEHTFFTLLVQKVNRINQRV